MSILALWASTAFAAPSGPECAAASAGIPTASEISAMTPKQRKDAQRVLAGKQVILSECLLKATQETLRKTMKNPDASPAMK